MSVQACGGTLQGWWYAGAGLTLVGSQCSAVADQSGIGDSNRNLADNGVTATYTASDPVFGGLPSLENINGSSTVMQFDSGTWSPTLPAATHRVWFLVSASVTLPQTSGTHQLNHFYAYNGATPADGVGWAGNFHSGAMFGAAGATNLGSIAQQNTNYHIYQVLYTDGASAQYWCDGALIATASCSGEAVTTLYVGGGPLNISEAGTYKWAELICASSPTTAGMNACFSYLVAKYDGIFESITTPSDAVARKFFGRRALAESVSVSDAIARKAIGHRSFAESIGGPSDALARFHKRHTAIAESITNPSDAAVRMAFARRGMAESIAVPSDAAVRRAIAGRGPSEIISTPADAISRRQTQIVSISEGAPTPTDAPSRDRAALRAVAETAPLPSDAVTRLDRAARARPESLATPADTAQRHSVGHRTRGENVPTPSDGVLRQTLGSKEVNEAIATPVDSAHRRGVQMRRIATETIGAVVVDTVSKVRLVTRTITETVGAIADFVQALFVHVLGPVSLSVQSAPVLCIEFQGEPGEVLSLFVSEAA